MENFDASGMQDVTSYARVQIALLGLVRIVFGLALRDKRQQIDMLQSIAELLQTPERLIRIAAAADGDELLGALDEALEPAGGGQ